MELKKELMDKINTVIGNGCDPYLHLPIKDEIYHNFLVAMANKYKFQINTSLLKKYIPYKATIHLTKNKIHYNLINSISAIDITLDELEPLLHYLTNQIRIDKNIVVFLPNGDIRVGCTTVKSDIINKIYKKSQEYQQESF